jgi:hypothetical protein
MNEDVSIRDSETGFTETVDNATGKLISATAIISIDGSEIYRYNPMRVMGAVFHWTPDRDADDISDLQKSPAYDIRKDRLEFFINTDQKFINEYLFGAPTNYAVILLPQNQMPQNFSTLRQAKILGAKVIQLGAQTRSVHRSG